MILYSFYVLIYYNGGFIKYVVDSGMVFYRNIIHGHVNSMSYIMKPPQHAKNCKYNVKPNVGYNNNIDLTF